MLYEWLMPLSDQFQIFNLFRYITFRTGGAMLTAMVFTFVSGPFLIAWLSRIQSNGQPIRKDGPQNHIVEKAGTPTMGGLLILLSLTLSALLWSDLKNPYIWVVMLVTLSYGSIGFMDDYLKVIRCSSCGLDGRIKLALEIFIALLAVSILLISIPNRPEEIRTVLLVPFFKTLFIPLGFFGSLAFGSLVISGSANAVNLTDGLDGLAIAPVMIAAASFGFIAYLVGHDVFSSYLQIHFVPGVGEIAVFLGALLGAGLGFLWYNAPPAMVFMGDTGSLSLGGALGAVAVAAKHEIVLAIIGGLFVLEAVSVIVQVVCFKLTGKRFFRMAPIHHHFESLGWKESTIVIRFWIIAIILALIGLSTLKLR